MIEATYRQPDLPEYQGNPLLEALPPILDLATTIDVLTNLPPYNHAERTHPTELRLHYLDRLYDIVQVQPEHLRVSTTVSRLIRHGYKSRNPLLPGFNAQAYQLATTHNDSIPPTPVYGKCRSGAYLTGLSGIGKSTIFERILQTYPQAIRHQSYRGRQFTQTQVVWLKLDCPHDGSQKQLCLSFFAALDEALDGATNYYEQNIGKRFGVEGFVPQMHQLCHSYHVGILGLDELQHLTSSPRGGETKTLNLVVNIMNLLGIPVACLGNPESAVLFTKTFRNARRVSFAGPIHLDRYEKDDPRFRLFLETIWHYQWTEKEVALTEPMVQAIYDASLAITDIVVAVYMLNQQRAITSGEETFTPEQVSNTVPEFLPILQPAMEALRRGDKGEYDRIRELIPPADQWMAAAKEQNEQTDMLALIRNLVQHQPEEPSETSEAGARTDDNNHPTTTNDDSPVDEQESAQLQQGSVEGEFPDLDHHKLRQATKSK